MTRKSLTLAILLFLAFGSQLWAASAPKKGDDEGKAAYKHYNKGVALLEKGEYAAAQMAFEKAIWAKEDFAEAHNNLGYVLRRQGGEHYNAALEHYDRALELDPKLAEAYMYRGVLHALSGDEDSARKDLEALNALNRELGDQLLQVLASGEEPEGHTGAAARWKD